MNKQAPSPPRRRNAATTREAILASAQRAFARAGYEGAGVREIAAGAGVTAMLVNRYFGSKEKLFAEAIEASMSTPTVLSAQNLGSPPSAAAMAEALVRITRAEDEPLTGFLILLRSVSGKRAAEIGRKQIEKGHQKTLTASLTADCAEQRAAVLLSLIAGFQVMRQMLGLRALTNAEPDMLVNILTPLFQQLVTGECAGGA